MNRRFSLKLLSIFGAGIWITHKVAGPLFSISVICGRVRDNKLSPSLRQLRRGDELQEFYSSFREMYEALGGWARVEPSTSTLTVPSGSLSNCRTVASKPT